MESLTTAADLRRWALKCANDAAIANEPSDRDRLLRMHDAFMQLAATGERLNGHASLESGEETVALAERRA